MSSHQPITITWSMYLFALRAHVPLFYGEHHGSILERASQGNIISRQRMRPIRLRRVVYAGLENGYGGETAGEQKTGAILRVFQGRRKRAAQNRRENVVLWSFRRPRRSVREHRSEQHGNLCARVTGREVALYLAKHLPDYVLQTSSYGEGKLSEALKEAFLQIDSDLLTDAALQELRELAGFHDDREESSESRCAEAVELLKEAEMPLEDLLAKYGCPTVKKTEGESAAEDAIEIIFEDDDDDDEEEDDEDDADDDDEDDDDDDDDDDDENSDKIEKKLDQEVEEDEEDKEPNDFKLKAFGDPGSSSGSTAIVCLLRDGVVTVANVGDSRCVLCSDGKAVDLSVDHKPTCETEKTRIEAAGGSVNKLGRVNNGLNLSRAIGE